MMITEFVNSLSFLSANVSLYVEEGRLSGYLNITWNCYTMQHVFKKLEQDYPGGAVVKNPPDNAGDTGSVPGLGRSHILWSS